MMIFDWVRICDRIGHARDVTRPACDRALPTPTNNTGNSGIEIKVQTANLGKRMSCNNVWHVRLEVTVPP